MNKVPNADALDFDNSRSMESNRQNNLYDDPFGGHVLLVYYNVPSESHDKNDEKDPHDHDIMARAC